MTASVKIERLLKKCFHEEQQKLILIIEVAERYVYMKSSKRRRPTSWCTGGHGARQERSQFCFHSQPSVPPCLPPSFLSLPSSSQPSDSSCLSPSSPPQQTFSVSCCFFTNHNLLLFLLAYLLLHHLLLILA